MSGKRDGPTLGDVVSTVSAASALIVAWLYAAGWSYADTYFDRFRIPLLMLDIPFEHILVYGGLCLQKNIWQSLVLSGFLVAVLWAVAHWASLLGRFAITAIVMALVVVTFTLAHVAGSAAAWSDFLRQRATDYRAYPRVALTWNGTAEPSDKVVADILTTDCGRLLVASKDRLFLIRPVREAGDLDLETFVVGSANIRALRLRGNYTSCGD